MAESPRTKPLRRPTAAAWLALAGIVAAAGLLLWVAPAELTLGTGIRTVYLHVAATWTGILGITVAGLLGLASALGGRRAAGLGRLGQTAGQLGLGFFIAGTALSLLASKVNWGNVSFEEPRWHTALSIIALGVMVHGSSLWAPWARLRGLLLCGLAVFMYWAVITTPLRVHPLNPINTSSSIEIRTAFYGMFVLASLLGVWLLWHIRSGKRPSATTDR